MRKMLHSGIFLLIASLAASPAMAEGPTESELSMQRILDRMNSIEKNMSTMQQELYRSNKGGKSNKKVTSDEPIGLDEEKNRAFNGKMEEIEHSVTVLTSKLDKIIADIDFRLAALEKAASAVPASVPAAIVPGNPTSPGNPVETVPAAVADITNSDEEVAPVAAKPTPAPAAVPATPPVKTPDTKPVVAAKPKNDPAAQYEKAFEYLRLSKYAESEAEFKNFITNNKGNDLIGNAYYWLGETFYSRQNYQQAAVNFLKGYQDFPKGNKAPDNLLKLAMSLKNLKKEKESCATLDKLKKEYPNMDKDLAVKASVERKGLKCSG